MAVPPLPMRAALVALALLATSGCDLLGPAGELRAGVVVERGTGTPIPGIHVSFQQSRSFGVYRIVAETTTDAAGRFRLRWTREALFINDPPY